MHDPQHDSVKLHSTARALACRTDQHVTPPNALLMYISCRLAMTFISLNPCVYFHGGLSCW